MTTIISEGARQSELDWLDKLFLRGLGAAETLGVGGTALKLYNDVVQRGRQTPITADDLSPEDLAGFRKIVERKAAETGAREGSIDYRDYKGDASQNIFGGFRYSIGDKGEIDLSDTWDFNRKTQTPDSENTAMRMLGAMFAPYHLASQIGRKAAPEGTGVPVRVSIPAVKGY